MDSGEFSDGALLRALLDALDSSGIGCTMATIEPAGIRTRYMNEAFAGILGVPLAEARATDPWKRVTADEATRLRELHEKVQSGEMAPPSYITTRILRPNGSELPVAAYTGNALIEGRRAIFCFVRDLSDVVAMQSALKASEDRFRTLAEASPDSIAIYVDHKCLYANPKALELYEMRAGELPSFDPFTVLATEQRDEMRAFVARVLEGKSVAPLTVRRTLKSGEPKVLEASLSTTTLDGNRAILAFTRDITERQRLQAELLKQDRLASLGVMAAGVAHELNNPLTALSLISNRLRAAAKPNVTADALAADLEQVDDAVKRMSAIIGDLLFLARPADQPHAHVDVAKVVESSVALLRAGVPACPEIALEIEELPPVQGVPSKLGQAIVNVLRNALQACIDRGDEAEVIVSARANGGNVVVVIEDNGEGIPEHVLPRLMTPFFTTKEGGTGLGLWITQGIMQSHGGRLDVTSTVGAGTKVTLSLPA